MTPADNPMMVASHLLADGIASANSEPTTDGNALATRETIRRLFTFTQMDTIAQIKLVNMSKIAKSTNTISLIRKNNG